MELQESNNQHFAIAYELWIHTHQSPFNTFR